MRFRRTLNDDLSAVRVVFGKRPVAGRIWASARRSFEIVTFGTSAVLFAIIGPLPLSMAWSGPVTGTVSFDYDPVSWEPASVTAGGVTAKYSFDADGAMTCLTTNGSTANVTCLSGLRVTADPSTRVATTRFPGDTAITDAVATRLEWTPYGEPSLFTSSWTGGSLTFEYVQRDEMGRIRELHETSGATLPREYEYFYDDTGRLTDVRLDDVLVEHYDYDANGNRTAVINATTDLDSASIVYDARDRLTLYGDVYFTYDAQGRLSTRQDRGVVPYATTTYEYDLLGALRRVQLPGGDVITYRVDGLGHRIEREVNGVVSARWIYLDGLRPIAEYGHCLDETGDVLGDILDYL